MKAHYEIIQRTDAWHNIKHGKIGGTRSAGLFVKSDTLAIELASEISEEWEQEDSFVNSAMQRGIDLEPLAIEQLEIYTSLKFNQVGWIQSTDNPMLGISPDGITECETIQCEIKCPSRKKHFENCLNNGIDKEYLPQLIHAFTVNNKLIRMVFCSFRPEALVPLSVRELTRESIVDLGTVAKPNLKTINEWVEISKLAGQQIQVDVTAMIDKLKF